MTTTNGNRGRARDFGIPFDGVTGIHNAITDVPGVEVGFSTLISGDGANAARTGVTAVLPRGRTGVGVPATAGVYSMNGNGELTGSHWLEEAGVLTLPVALTNSHAVGTVHRSIIDWVIQHHPAVAQDWLLPVVAETYDGDLNDINGLHITDEHVRQALDTASNGEVHEGNVGGGTGMNCYEFKGGSGTSSRVVDYGDKSFRVGVFVQANFGSREELVVAGVAVGRMLSDDNPFRESPVKPPGGGSVIAIVATDAPLLPNQCKALARRVPLGLARTGTSGSHFSGDIFLAFSTANETTMHSGYTDRPAVGQFDSMTYLPWANIDALYAATVQGVEEAVVNALCAAETMTGRNGFRSPALPVQRLTELLRPRAR